SPANNDLLEFGSTGESSRRLIVIDRNICQYYLNNVVEYFEYHKINYRILPLEIDEENKDIDSLITLLKEMEQFGILRRDEPLIAIGGGVLLDIAGMAASMYRRGIPYIRVPTTLVGLIDASIGIKTGINFENRRNRLGAYFPPIASYLDKSFLGTLNELEISSGLGEILKMGVILDYQLFVMLENHSKELLESKFLESDVADEVINRSVQGMKDELEDNLWEIDLKRIVDFGHSFSPIIEMRSIHDNKSSPLTHGQAVTLDVIISSIISNQRGMLSYQDLLRIVKTAKNMMLPTYHELFTQPSVILEALKDTMKHRNGNQNLPIPQKIGEPVFINDLTYDEIIEATQTLSRVNVELA
ncbi:sedoheptulose 7-phosphate cyclase, partial [Chloroflexota bacterium]